MNTKYLKLAFGMTLILLFASACGFIPTRGSGDLLTETRRVSGFDAVEFSGAGEVEIIQDGTESITIETDDDVMPHVLTEVEDGTLNVGFDFTSMISIIPTRMHVTLHVIDLNRVTASGAWSVESDSLETGSLRTLISGTGSITIGSLVADELVADISGAGEMEIAGQVASQAIGISGTGRFLAGDLQSETTEIDISGSGKATLWVTTSLDVSVSGSGTVEYYGSPQVSFTQSGSGDVSGLGEK